MKAILTIKQQDFEPDSPVLDSSNFETRHASRGVLLDDKGEVYLLNVSKFNYHKLPGGGIDEGETPLLAFERELMEEVGCKCEVIQELGEIVEYRDFRKGVQTSYCYLARQVGEQVESALEEGELEEGMYEVKAKNIDEAIKILENDKPANIEGKFIQKRDLFILKKAKEFL
jgi:8-oxo-dGTP diphosphatase